jgi:hypothetical protein
MRATTTRPGSASCTPDRGRRAEAHGRGAAGRDKPARRRQRVALRDAVLVPTDIRDEHGVGRNGSIETSARIRSGRSGNWSLSPSLSAAFEQISPGGSDPLAQPGT